MREHIYLNIEKKKKKREGNVDNNQTENERECNL